MTQDLYRLILCLASAERQTVLFDRISDEDEELEEDGVTEEIVKAGIEWWENNIPLINEIAKSFTKSFMDTADDNNFNVGTFFDQWGIETWSDFISESFECIWSFGNNDDFDYFFDYAVKQSLGFNIGTWEGEDSQGARGIEISDVEWEVGDGDQHPEKAAEKGIRSVPTVMIYNGDTLVETIVGVVSKNDYTKVITNAKNIF